MLESARYSIPPMADSPHQATPAHPHTGIGQGLLDLEPRPELPRRETCGMVLEG
jgi:hypothetical protein